MIRTLVIILLFLSNSITGQSLLAKFYKLSRPEKCWTFFHPFAAKKAFKATIQSQVVTDSIKKSGSIGTDNSGGRLDAFKHAYWIACVSATIGSRKALKLGKAHEKGNKLQFKKHQLEDCILPDSVSSVMDLHNNEQGATAAKKIKGATPEQLEKAILNLLNLGYLACIKKDEQGNFLTCEGKPIDMNQWMGKWNVPKCIITSNAN